MQEKVQRSAGVFGVTAGWYLARYLMPPGFTTGQSTDAHEEDNMGGEEPGAAGLPEES